jgi:hypothetical protein
MPRISLHPIDVQRGRLSYAGKRWQHASQTRSMRIRQHKHERRPTEPAIPRDRSSRSRPPDAVTMTLDRVKALLVAHDNTPREAQEPARKHLHDTAPASRPKMHRPRLGVSAGRFRPRFFRTSLSSEYQSGLEVTPAGIEPVSPSPQAAMNTLKKNPAKRGGGAGVELGSRHILRPPLRA